MGTSDPNNVGNDWAPTGSLCSLWGGSLWQVSGIDLQRLAHVVQGILRRGHGLVVTSGVGPKYCFHFAGGYAYYHLKPDVGVLERGCGAIYEGYGIGGSFIGTR